MGKIKNIEIVTNVMLNRYGSYHVKSGARLGIVSAIDSLKGCGGYDGYLVETETDKFYILISNGQNCCEDWGYLDTNDNSKKFIGSELLNVSIVDQEYNKKFLMEADFSVEEENQICFVTFETDKGDFQLAVYNSHNGYYGHDIIIVKNTDIIHQDTL